MLPPVASRCRQHAARCPRKHPAGSRHQRTSSAALPSPGGDQASAREERPGRTRACQPDANPGGADRPPGRGPFPARGSRHRLLRARWLPAAHRDRATPRCSRTRDGHRASCELLTHASVGYRIHRHETLGHASRRPRVCILASPPTRLRTGGHHREVCMARRVIRRKEVMARPRCRARRSSHCGNRRSSHSRSRSDPEPRPGTRTRCSTTSSRGHASAPAGSTGSSCHGGPCPRRSSRHRCGPAPPDPDATRHPAPPCRSGRFWYAESQNAPGTLIAGAGDEPAPALATATEVGRIARCRRIDGRAGCASTSGRASAVARA